MLHDAAPYVLPDETIEITFGPETRHPGVTLEIRTTLTVDDALTLEPLLAGLDGRSADERRQALMLFGQNLIVDWNLHEQARDAEGQRMVDAGSKPVLRKVPVTGENFVRRIDFQLATAALLEWRKVVMGEISVSAPLETPAPSTSPGPPVTATEAAGEPLTPQPDDAFLSLLN